MVSAVTFDLKAIPVSGLSTTVIISAAEVATKCHSLMDGFMNKIPPYKPNLVIAILHDSKMDRSHSWLIALIIKFGGSIQEGVCSN